VKVEQVKIMVGLALLCAAGFALADVPKLDSPATAATPETVVVVEASWNCGEVSAERARSLAAKASQDGAYQRAGECYLAAGEDSLANQAFARASAQASGDTSRRLAANLNDVKADVKAQARQMKQAFQRR
jgi:hypothetical protein